MNEEFLSYEEAPVEKYNKIKNIKVFVGCNIKSLYDEKRIRIKEEFNPIRIEHCGRNLFGTIFEPSKKHLFFVRFSLDVDSLDLYSYNKLLSENNLSCDENFAYLTNKLYPVDSKYICEYIPNFKYSEFFEDDLNVPVYQNIKSVNMFFLTPE
jgi:hypothetical protein